MATSRADAAADRPAAAPAPLVPVAYRVKRRRRETADTWTLALVPARDGAAIAPFAPGQFAMLYAFGAGEAAVSVSGDPAQPEELVHTVRAVGAVTSRLCRAREGEQIGVRGPYGRAWPIEEAEGSDLVIAAGGIGLAPLRPVVRHVLAQRQRYGSVAVLYGGRSPGALIYRRELEEWRGRLDLDVQATVDGAPGDWRGRVGLVTELISGARFDPDHTVAMVCGPEAMMRFTVRALRDRGVPGARIHVSLERHMKCAVAHCGRCQLGPAFVCREGPVFAHDAIAPFLEVPQL